MKKDKVAHSKYPYVIFNEKLVSSMMDNYYKCVIKELEGGENK